MQRLKPVKQSVSAEQFLNLHSTMQRLKPLVRPDARSIFRYLHSTMQRLKQDSYAAIVY